MSPNGDLIQAFIQEVREKALNDGLKGLTDREFQALMSGWQTEQMRAAVAGQPTATLLDKARQMGLPAITYGGVAAVILKLLDLLGQ